MKTIQSLEAFIEWADQFKKMGACFRGQTTDYGTLIPSIFRRDSKLDITRLGTEIQEHFDEAYGVWEEYRNSLPKEDPQEDYGTPVGVAPQLFEGPWYNDESGDAYDDNDGIHEENWGLASFGPKIEVVGHGFPEVWPAYHARAWVDAGKVHCALLQHYGIPTPTLDASTDPLIGLWFATQEMHCDSEDRAYYQQTGTAGVVYALSPRREQVFDLSSRFVSAPIFGLRGDHQAGVLVAGATEDQPDISKLISDSVRVNPGLIREAEHRLLKRLSQDYLFPGPDMDKLYARLIAEKKCRPEGTGKLLDHVIEYVLV